MEDALSERDKAEQIAEHLRQEPYRLLINDCLTKSIRFRRECRKLGIDARLVFCAGLVPARIPILGRRITVLVLHAWGEVAGERMEVSRPLGAEGILGIRPVEIRPVLALRR
ncbi:MAG: hypothetical protein DRI39_02890 [Chloroflexi bacterium]|nr:MAG: hypothetical protein DRI39_02890 [Chloroflexota bacterium]